MGRCKYTGTNIFCFAHTQLSVILDIHDIYYLESDFKMSACFHGFSGLPSIMQFTAA